MQELESHPNMRRIRCQRKPRYGFAKVAIVAGLAIFAIATFAGIFAWVVQSDGLDPSIHLNAGLRLLKKGKPQEARLLAAAIGDNELANASDQAKQKLILGAAALDEAEKLDSPQYRYNKSLEAEAHLTKADLLGFPRGYEGLGKFLLGKVLFRLFRWEQAVEPLEMALSEWPSGRSQSLERLIDIELRKTPIDEAKVLSRLDQWEAMAGLTDDERDLGKIKRIEAEYMLEDWQECLDLCHHFPGDSTYAPKASYLQAAARVKIREKSDSPKIDANDEEIESRLRNIVRNASAEAETRRRAEYLLGQTLLQQNRLKESLTVLSSLRQKSPDSIEGLMAAIEEMLVTFRLGEYEQVAKLLKQVKEQLGKLEWYQNAWVTFDTMRDRINEIGSMLLANEAYAETLQFAENLPPFCRPEDGLRLAAFANHRWAMKLKGDALPDDVLLDIREIEKRQSAFDEINKKQQQLYSRAAHAYEALARIELRSPGFSDLIWSAIHCSQAAGELAYCNSIIISTMDFEPRDYHPRSLIKMSENHFAMQQPEKALFLLDRCINQFPDHPLSYQARLNSARILSEQGKVDEAVRRLEENLYLSGLTPDNATWRESLYELGRSLYDRGEKYYLEAEQLKEQLLLDQKAKRLELMEQSYSQFLASIDRLEEWIQRYPNDNRRFDTLYSVGQAYQMAAQWPRIQVEEKQLASEELIRAKLLEQRKLFEASARTYKEIREGMSNTQEWSMLEPSQQRLLRNSYFAEADLLQQAKNFEGALSAYRNIANRLVNEPEALEALVQAAECLRALGRHEESLGVVAQAREILQQIPPQRDATFTTLTRFNRSQWSEHLKSLGQSKL